MPFALLLLLGAAAPLTPPQLDVAGAYSKNFTLPEFEAIASTNHEQFDLNHDGFVTLDEEIKATSAMVGKPIDPPLSALAILQTIFDDADTNHDGRISAEENQAGVDRQFESNDTDHDGIVTPKEQLAGAMLSAQRLAGAVSAAHQEASK